ncbi:lipase [Coprinopsis cinerea AmutBmut pab1-1]|nr:lipase [Coprinopsis cinerea AmutBmut pab1-1]
MSSGSASLQETRVSVTKLKGSGNAQIDVDVTSVVEDLEVITTADSEGPDPTPISTEKYEELVHYFKYASSSYALICPRPCGNKLVSTFSNAVTDIQGFVARDEKRKELVVALRGSASIADIILDANIILVPALAPGIKAPSGARVHAGFLTAWNSVALQVLTIVQTQLKRHPEIEGVVTTGHSLGGAVALLGALSLVGKVDESVKVRTYSYGSPRAGNRVFADHIQELFGERAHRVVNSNDGVPTMIPRRLGYHHHGVEYWQNGKPMCGDTTLQCDPDGEDPKCSASIPSKGVNMAHTRYFGILVTTPFCL